MSKLQLRKDTAANWTLNNPILLSGEPGFETDTGILKIGDGVTQWADLAGISGGGGGGGLTLLEEQTTADLFLFQNPASEYNAYVFNCSLYEVPANGYRVEALFIDPAMQMIDEIPYIDLNQDILDPDPWNNWYFGGDVRAYGVKASGLGYAPNRYPVEFNDQPKIFQVILDINVHVNADTSEQAFGVGRFLSRVPHGDYAVNLHWAAAKMPVPAGNGGLSNICLWNMLMKGSSHNLVANPLEYSHVRLYAR